jgi:uncharacterized membrane protein YphA (DoxX/SURF4 family)
MTWNPSNRFPGQTSEGGGVWLARKTLALVFLIAGIVKLAVPQLADAFTGQLLASGLPYYDVTRWAVPAAEILIGLLMFAGRLVRLSAALILAMMGAAIYVHLTIEDASLFPLQPNEPIIPILVIALALVVMTQSQ